MTWHPTSAHCSAAVQDDLSGQCGSGHRRHKPSTGAVGKPFLWKGQQHNLKNTHKLSCSEWK